MFKRHRPRWNFGLICSVPGWGREQECQIAHWKFFEYVWLGVSLLGFANSNRENYVGDNFITTIFSGRRKCIRRNSCNLDSSGGSDVIMDDRIGRWRTNIIFSCDRMALDQYGGFILFIRICTGHFRLEQRWRLKGIGIASILVVRTEAPPRFTAEARTNIWWFATDMLISH